MAFFIHFFEACRAGLATRLIVEVRKGEKRWVSGVSGAEVGGPEKMQAIHWTVSYHHW